MVALGLLVASETHAGIWGEGKWGQMYWGSNLETAPTVAPAVNTWVDGTDVRLTLTNLVTGPEVGWSALVHFEVTCGDEASVVVLVDDLLLTDFEPDTEYSCTIVAINEANGQMGRSPLGTFAFITDALGGFPVWLLYQAYAMSAPKEVPSGMPTNVTITRSDFGDGEITLWVTADEGDSAITGYDAICTDGTNTFTGTSTSSAITVSGLTNEVAYTCTVTATNSVGTSSASAETAPITPEETPNGLPIWLIYEASTQ